MTNKDKKALELFMERAELTAEELCRYAASSMLQTAVTLQLSEDQNRKRAGEELMSRYLKATPIEEPAFKPDHITGPEPAHTTEQPALFVVPDVFQRRAANRVHGE